MKRLTPIEKAILAADFIAPDPIPGSPGIPTAVVLAHHLQKVPMAKKAPITTSPAAPARAPRAEFDEDLDVLIAEIGTVPASRDGGLPLVVQIKAYNGGTPKIQVNRTGEKRDGTPYTTKMGSLDAGEARALAKLLIRAAGQL